MHPTLTQLLRGARPILLDGAWGTQLQARGLAVGASPEAWNLERPEAVEEVARAYREAGSAVILTNTFGGNRLVLERHGLAGQVAEINRRGVELSRAGAGDQALVFASVGPTGRLLLMEETTEEELHEVFTEQIDALVAGGAQGLVLETFSDLGEIGQALTAARRTGLPVVASLVYDAGEKFDRTLMGVSPAQQAEALAEADVLGANCGRGIAPYLEVCRQLRAASRHPLWIKPNAGLPRMVEGRAVYSMSPAEFASFAPAFREAGADFLGGCCGTSPDFIRALAQLR